MLLVFYFRCLLIFVVGKVLVFRKYTQSRMQKEIFCCLWLGPAMACLKTMKLRRALKMRSKLFSCFQPQQLKNRKFQIALGRGGHKAMDTELTYAPVSQAYGHRHKLQFNV